jgi:hypothetical protein
MAAGFGLGISLSSSKPSKRAVARGLAKGAQNGFIVDQQMTGIGASRFRYI